MASIGEYNGVTFELGIRNRQGLAANFHAADTAVTAAMRDLVTRTVSVFDSVWESLTPVDKGFMVEHRHIILTNGGLGFEAGWDAGEFPRAFYPYFQEFGTSRMRAQPSLGPAYQYIAPQFAVDMSDVLRAAIARLSRG
jgi:HK97 gp10 family phage protein